MSRAIRRLWTDVAGAGAVEFALAVPVLVTMIWGLFQLGIVLQANAGVQEALGEGARLLTIYPTPSTSTISTRITSAKFGVGDGTWSTPTISALNATNNSRTITVSYSQPLNFLFFHGLTVTITKSKVVYLSN